MIADISHISQLMMTVRSIVQIVCDICLDFFEYIIVPYHERFPLHESV